MAADATRGSVGELRNALSEEGVSRSVCGGGGEHELVLLPAERVEV